MREALILMAAFLAAMPATAATLPSADKPAAMKAAGLRLSVGQWKSGDCDGMEGASYTPGAVESVSDLNGDGQPEAVITEGGACFGQNGTHFWLVSKQADGGWRLIHQETGVAIFLKTKGAGGWPDLEVGGAGFCFPVLRWNGRAYANHRRQYEGKPCR